VLADSWQPRRHLPESLSRTYTPVVERRLIFRNVACLSSVPPTEFDVDAFEAKLDLGKPEDQTVLDRVSITVWEKAQLQILPDRMQLGFRKAADESFVRLGADEFVARIQQLLPNEPVGFSAMMGLTLADGEEDPSVKLFDAKAVAGNLGGSEGRGGITAVFNDASSRWWIELSPQPDEPSAWTYDFNRVFSDLPTEGGARDEAIGWFANVEAELIAQFETITGGAD
jgi:hypothetical protein